MAFIDSYKKLYKKAFDKIIKSLPIYYKSITRMPVANWFEVKDGNMQAMYKYTRLKYTPVFFYDLYHDMHFQFDKLDLRELYKKVDIALLKAMAARNEDKVLSFKVEQMENEIRLKEIENKDNKDLTLNEFIDYIELTFESIGKIDPYKISTARAFSLFERAKSENERKKKQLEKMR
jgi:hypothetical protein